MKSIIADPDWLPKLVNFLFAGLALLLVAASLFAPWYALPRAGDLNEKLVTQDANFTPYFKAVLIFVTFAFAVAGVVLRHRIPSYGTLILRYSVCCLVVVLWFPTWMTIRDAEIAGDGAWLQQQHDTMTWLGGDVYRAHAERSVDLGTGVNAQDPPARLAVYRPPSGSLGLQRVNDWLWWLGYGPTFAQFVGKGWFLAMGGYTLGAICLCGYYWRKSIASARLLYRKLVGFSFVLLAMVLSPTAAVVVMTKSNLSQSEAATACGDYREARAHLRSAIRWMPSLGCDSGVIRQLGYFDERLGDTDSDHATLYRIFWFEQQGYYERARKLVDEMAERKSEMSRECVRELSRHQLRIGINLINSGRYRHASRYLDQLIHHEGNCIQACFHRQLVALQSGDLAVNRAMNEELRYLYQGVKRKDKRGVIAASWWMLSQGELKAGNTEGAWEARKESKGQ
ncbi:hypothetical protein JIN77_14930 [Verrucomicrobiaceae bacterium R5-34]|nr:hypothetical protein [Verrucomicrobiaceae bacterium R5-34]